jgi:ribonucleoside-diphosphate reductase alpha chain
MKPLAINRIFSKAGSDPFDDVPWDKRIAEITDDKGRTIFRQADVTVPAFWSQLATNVVASKYFYGEQGTAERETDVRQLIHRVCRTIADWGISDGYFGPEEGEVFYAELAWLCLHQYGAFNSPVWFNVGLHQVHAVGKSSSPGNWHYNPKTQRTERAATQYEFPQCSACFIQSVDDNMESIMDLAKSEAMLFKFGSGTGTDLTPLRSNREKLSGGGRPSGPLSFLQVYDQVAAIVKSGGKTRRAAKMNTLRDWHGDIEEFIEAKQKEEKKARALIDQGYDGSFNGEAYGSVRFQNENLSVRASDEFMEAAATGGRWWTKSVTTGKPIEKKDAASLLSKIAEGTWMCGDPGMQFDGTIQKWHTCKGTEPIHSTNPCSEYVFLNNTACNLASLNLLMFRREDGVFEVERFQAAVRLFIIAQDILVDHSSYPTPEIAENSHRFRTLGLGYANLGSLIMSYGLPYDSAEARSLTGAITAVMTGEAYCQSALLAERMGAFPSYHDARCAHVRKPAARDNVGPMLDVIQEHRRAAQALCCSKEFEHVGQKAVECWDQAITYGRNHGYRNAQVTVLAPTGTISFLMDCDTTGIEPDIALVKYKLLAGGGMLKIVNRTVSEVLRKLGYAPEQSACIIQHIERYDTIEDVVLQSADEAVTEAVSQAGETAQSGLKTEHLPIFDCAFKPSRGRRSLHYRAHLGIMSAAQPFISGAISKTVNVPNTATVEEIRQVYLEAWRMGLKCVAIYRDGSKYSQPLNTSRAAGDGRDNLASQLTNLQKELEQLRKQVGQPARRRMPETRASFTHKFSIAGHEGYFTVGLFENGQPGELFITMAKEGSTIGGLMDTIATLVSLSLQYGVPLEDLVRKFAHQRFEPSGYTPNPQIRMAKSIVDYIFRWLGMTFLSGYEGSDTDDVPVNRLIRARDGVLAGRPGSGLLSSSPSTNGHGTPVKTSSHATNGNMASLQTDAPPCQNCGAIMIRNGTCYRCPGCGESSGCG